MGVEGKEGEKRISLLRLALDVNNVWRSCVGRRPSAGLAHLPPCWVCQDVKAMTAVYLGRFSGLCLQQEPLTDETTYPSGTQDKLAYCLL